MSFKPDRKKGYAFVDNAWIFDERIKTELRLLIYISSLTAKDGYAYANNEHLAKEFNTTTVTISRQIAKLIKLGYVTAEYERYGTVIQKRYLRLTKMLTDREQKCKPAVNKNVKDNTTRDNTTSINNDEINFENIKILPEHAKMYEYLNPYIINSYNKWKRSQVEIGNPVNKHRERALLDSLKNKPAPKKLIDRAIAGNYKTFAFKDDEDKRHRVI